MNYRNRANLTLTLVFIAFFLVALARHIYPEVSALGLVYFVLEAALVGGVADWFAVTALFRKPLGFPYHTALIPRNREKVIQGVTNMVEGDLLSKEAIKQRVAGIHFDRLIVNFLNRNSLYREVLAAKAGQALVYYLQNLDRAWAAGKLENYIKSRLQNLEAVMLLNQGTEWFFANGLDEKSLDYLLEELRMLVAGEGTRAKLYEFLQAQKQEQTRDNFLKSFIAGLLESTDSLNLEEAAQVLQTTLMENLQEFKDHAHPVRLRIKEIVRQNIIELGNNPDWVLSVERWKRETLENFPLEDVLLSLVDSLLAAATNPGHTNRAPIAQWVEGQLGKYWEHFQQDQALLQWFDRWCKEIIARLVEAEHYLVGEIVTQTLGDLSNEGLNRFIEDKAGNDLQWIRINGSIVGGAIGLALYLFVSYVYDPWVVPIIQGWVQ